MVPLPNLIFIHPTILQSLSPWQDHGESQVESHADYLRLGTDPAERQAAYRELSQAHIAPEMLKAFRQATHTNRVFGSELFQKQIEAALALQIQKRKPGPRRKESS